MCYNIVIINKSNKSKKIGDILSEIFNKFKYNNDGAFIYNSTDNLLVRTLNYAEAEKLIRKQKLKNENLLHMHLRLASSGEISVDNIHGWRFGNWLCSHNGSYLYATNYYSYYNCKLASEGKKSKKAKISIFDNDSEDDEEAIPLVGKSDSYEFFEKNAEAINNENIEKIDVAGFYGVAYCNNITNRHLIIISKNKSAKLYYLNGLLLISNEELDVLLSKYYKIGDLEFIQEPTKTRIEDKIVLLDTKTLKILKERKIETSYKYSGYFYSGSVLP